MNSSLAHVFRAYDIRGLSPSEISSEFAARLARALVRVRRPRKVLIGRDMRLTSAELEEALVQTFIAAGVDVVLIDLCTTPLFNVSVGLQQGQVDIGIMITASHNPGAYNGFKIVDGRVRPIGQGSGMEELAEAWEQDIPMPPGDAQGCVTRDILALSRYVDRIVELAQLWPSMPKRKIVIDAGNGMAAAVLPELLAKLPWLEVVPLYFKLDGDFPNHEANPLKRETLEDLRRTVKAEKADFGVAFDGDADRIGFVDETGEVVPGDLATALFAQELLRLRPGGLVLYDLRSSWSVPRAILAAAGRAEMCRVGHAFIKHRMKETGAVFAGEMSMHYYFSDLFGVESGDLALLQLLKRLAREETTLSALWKPFQRYAHSGELNFVVSNPSEVIARLKDRYISQASAFTDMDGIRLEFCDGVCADDDWWFSVRASNTEPVLRLNVESCSQERTAAHVRELADALV